LNAAVMGWIISLVGFEKSFFVTAAMILATTGLFSWMLKGFPPKGGMEGA